MMSRFAAAADRCRRGAFVIAWLATFTSAAKVRAQAERIELSWDAPKSCPTADDVLARVRSLAGGSAAGLPLRAAGTVTQRADGSYHLRLVVHKAGLVGERELVARKCHDLAGAAAVYIALLVDDHAPLPAASATAAEPSPAVTTTTGPAAAPSPPTAEPARESAPIVARALLEGPSISLSIGPMPVPSVGFSLAGGAAFGPWHIVAGGTVWLRQSVGSTRPDTSASVDRLQVNARACRAFELSRFGLAPCLTVSVEHLRANGSGPYVRTAIAATSWLAAGARLEARYPVTPWFNVLCSADLKVQTARPRISVEGIGPLTELEWYAAEVSLGSEWIL